MAPKALPDVLVGAWVLPLLGAELGGVILSFSGFIETLEVPVAANCFALHIQREWLHSGLL